jgi:hypothetical protein
LDDISKKQRSELARHAIIESHSRTVGVYFPEQQTSVAQLSSAFWRASGYGVVRGCDDSTGGTEAFERARLAGAVLRTADYETCVGGALSHERGSQFRSGGLDVSAVCQHWSASSSAAIKPSAAVIILRAMPGRTRAICASAAL